MINENTSRNYPLPHPENIAKQDVLRMREAFIAVDSDMNSVNSICTKLNENYKREKFESFIEFWEKK